MFRFDQINFEFEEKPCPTSRQALRACPKTKPYEVQGSGVVLTLRLPPVRVTLTKRRVYVSLFLARPLGTFFFSCFSTLGL